MSIATIREFLRHEASAGLLLMATAALALVLDNSPLSPLYERLIATPVSVQVGELEIDKPLLLWINDGLMAVFFLLVGLEIKREVLEGELSSRSQIMLPGIAALGGMVVPAAVYVAINWDNPGLLDGWAIPAATDIAFALGILALLGSRVPVALKVFLLALAIIDDLGAIIIIAVYYTADLSLASLAVAGVGAVALLALNRSGVLRLAPYILIGIVMWVGVLKSGVHATLAGVVMAMAIPLRSGKPEVEPPLKRLEHALHPWVAFGVLPAFAFANAGVSLAGLSLGSFLEPLPLGILLGLFLGKQAGILGAVWLGVRAGLCRLPSGVTWLQIYGVALLAGIGFTMSLFIGTLAFADPSYSAGIRLGVLGGSILSASLGYLVLRLALSERGAGAAAQGTQPSWTAASGSPREPRV